MIIQITNVSIKYTDGNVEGAQVYFNGYDQGRTLNVNGNFPLTKEEYVGNESIAALTTIVKQRVIEKLSNQSAV